VQKISEIEVQGRLIEILDNLAIGHEPITITRNGEEAAVMVTADEYASIQETLYLLSSPANAKRLSRGLDEFKGSGEPLTSS
jgi:antitoxin YefM